MSTAVNEFIGSIPVLAKSRFRRLLAFFGPAYLVSVGYMDPGNWATDLEAGSRFGYSLLWVILASSIIAVVLQTLCVRLGIAMQMDLAQACSRVYSKRASTALWILCELAIIACDIAEVIGSAVALNLLFNIPTVIGVIITGADVLLLLGLMKFGFRKIEAIITTLVATVATCFMLNLRSAHPDWGDALKGLVPVHGLSTAQLAVAIGIIGATVMPHNLYLHSSIVQSRKIEDTPPAKTEAIRSATIDTVVALGLAFFVNAAILVLAAAVFNRTHTIVKDFGDAHHLLAPALGGGAATLFAVALLASGQSSTLTGTLAGQIVMEGFTRYRIKPWIRRMISRGLAIIPAVFLVSLFHGQSIDPIVISQIVLSMQLPFAVVPLVQITSDPLRMGQFVNPKWLTAISWLFALAIVSLNIWLLITQFGFLVSGLFAVALAGYFVWSRGTAKELRAAA